MAKTDLPEHAHNADAQRPDRAADPLAQESETIPVIEEQLEIGRRSVETGFALRVRKEVEVQPVEFDEPLVHEFVEAERVRIERVIEAPVQPRYEGDVLVVPVVEERLVVQRQLVLVEEVRITRRREERGGRVQEQLRRERVVIERRDPHTGEWVAAEPPA